MVRGSVVPVVDPRGRGVVTGVVVVRVRSVLVIHVLVLVLRVRRVVGRRVVVVMTAPVCCTIRRVVGGGEQGWR